MQVAIFFGSRSDTDKMKGAAQCLRELEISFEAFILSAHRVPEKLDDTLADVEKRGAEVIIAGAGLAAHLPGVIASKTLLPVIGVPLNAALGGLDALYAIVQMPKAIAVATVGVDNSYNAGMLAAQILAIKYEHIKQKLQQARAQMKKQYIADSEKGVQW